MESAIQTAQAASAVEWSPQQVETIKRTVAKGATNDELGMFLHLSQQYGLDPFAKDLWFIKMGNQAPVIMTSRDGYLKIAQRNADYDGIDSDVVYENDSFRKTREGVSHEYSVKNRGRIVGAYALVYRKSIGRPVYVFAPFGDYNKGNGTWKTYGHAMILKVAEAMALKRAFSLSGLVTSEELDEAPRMDGVPSQAVDAEIVEERPAERPQEQRRQQRPEPRNTAETKKQLYERYLAVCGGQPDHARNAMLKVTEGRGSKDWTDEDLIALGVDILAREKKKAAPPEPPADDVIDADMWEPDTATLPMFTEEEGGEEYTVMPDSPQGSGAAPLDPKLCPF